MVCAKSLFTGAALLLAGCPIALADPASLTQTGGVATLTSPSTTTVELHWQSQSGTAGNTDPLGLSISAEDGQIGSPAVPITIGRFSLLRPGGAFYWTRAADATSGNSVTMLDLNNDHSLTLHPADGGTAYEIVFRPWATGPFPATSGGIYFNGARVLTAGDPVYLGSGGGPNLIDQYLAASLPNWNIWQDLYRVPGLVAAGTHAIALGPDSVAFGDDSFAGIYSQAFGKQAYADGNSVALGEMSKAGNYGIAIGDYAVSAGFHALAYGGSAYSIGNYSMAFGPSSSGPGFYCVAMDGNASANYSFAGAWGNASGVASIALGGCAHGYKSFAANSGTAFGDYSTAIGRGTLTRRANQVAVGVYNLDTTIANDSSDPLFVIGNGTVSDTAPSIVRSNAFVVTYGGDTKVAGGLSVDGGPEDAKVTTVFQRDVSVKGVLRVPESGDLSMGDFKNGTQP